MKTYIVKFRNGEWLKIDDKDSFVFFISRICEVTQLASITVEPRT